MILTHIEGIPLFSTKYEAMEVGFKTYGLQGYHRHDYNGRVGFMYGATHAEIKEAIKNKKTDDKTTTPTTPLNVIPSRIISRAPVRDVFAQENVIQPVRRQLPRTTTTTRVATGGGGGGGY